MPVKMYWVKYFWTPDKPFLAACAIAVTKQKKIFKYGHFYHFFFLIYYTRYNYILLHLVKGVSIRTLAL